MILAIDCGNTLIKVGAFDDKGQLVKQCSLKTDEDKSAYEYAVTIKSLLEEYPIITGAIIGSVVPMVTERIKDALNINYKINALILDKTLKTKMPIKLDNPNELGSDMLAAAIGGYRKYQCPVLICDLGTATKLFLVDDKGAFSGGIITSGLGINLKTLVGSTSLLSDVPLSFPKNIIGKNTKDAIQSGILNGHVEMIKGLTNEIEASLPYKVVKILTGGYSKNVYEKIPSFKYEPTLLFEGLYYIYKDNVYEK